MASILGSGVDTPLTYFFVALAVAAFIVETWAFVDVIFRPTAAIAAAASAQETFLRSLTKTAWLIILGIAFALGLYSAAYGGATGFLSVLAFVAAATYLAGVRPKAKEYGKGRSRSSNTHMGPYGPW